MNLRSAVKFGLAPSLLLGSLAMATPSPEVQAEIGFLLQHVEESGCEFYRNGSWYDSKRASAHLNDKYQYLLGRGQISTTFDFIDRAATKSSMTGIPYQIKCAGAPAIDSRSWLLQALADHRQLWRRQPPDSLTLPASPGRFAARQAGGGLRAYR